MLLKEEFLQSNPTLLREFRMVHLLKAPELIERISQRIALSYEAYVEHQEQQPYNEEIPFEYILGSIAIGRAALNPNIIIKADIENLSGHILSIGATGGGKTHLNLWILHQIQMQFPKTCLRYIVFASKRGCEQRNLIVNNKPGTSFYLDKNTLAINPFSLIPNASQEVVIAEASRILSNEMGLLVGGQLYLQDKMFQFINQYKQSTFQNFVEWLSRKKEYSYDLKGYHDRLIIRLKSLLFETGNVFNCYYGIEDRQFVENNIIIELPCSSTFIMSAIAGLILGRMYRYKSANQESLQYKNLIILEDIQGAMQNV